MNKDEKSLNNGLLPSHGGVNWKPAVQLFSQVSVWIVAPIIIALIVGKSLDSYFGTKPIIFLILTGIGFVFTCIGMVKIIRNYIKELKEIEQSEKKD